MEAIKTRVLGYNYTYRFLADEDIISRYDYQTYPDQKTFLFEIRTNFILTTIDGADYIIGSETFGTEVSDDAEFKLVISYLLLHDEYWMTEDDVRVFEVNALDFAKMTMASPEHARSRVIPIGVDLEVRTVQLEGEMIGSALNRAIKAVVDDDDDDYADDDDDDDKYYDDDDDDDDYYYDDDEEEELDFS